MRPVQLLTNSTASSVRWVWNCARQRSAGTAAHAVCGSGETLVAITGP
ncbi:MAG TPA: hypothetical protein VN667_18535 [Burkholderiales bacterium]|nr:hypothetical protein [Burkholderiales bacterium]